MAVPPSTADEAFLREVDDAVRQDQLRTAWQRYGRVGIAIVVAALVAFGGYLAWKDYREKRSGETAEVADRVLRRASVGTAPDAKDVATLSSSSVPGYRAIAALAKAAQEAKSGNLKGAMASYAAIAADESFAQSHRDLALVRQVALGFDTMTPQQAIDKLKPLAVEGQPWFPIAGEMTAIAYMKMGKQALAGPIFAAVSADVTAPDSLRSRARQMAGLLGIDAVDTAAPNAGEENTNNAK